MCGSAAQFMYPESLAVDGMGNVFVADERHDSESESSRGGDNVGGPCGGGWQCRRPGHCGPVWRPRAAAVDNTGNVYVADSRNCTIRKVSPWGVVTTLAGKVGEAGSADGPGSTARFNNPQAVAVDSAGNVYVADNGNNAIRKVTATGMVTI